jgi:hypothetical protein
MIVRDKKAWYAVRFNFGAHPSRRTIIPQRSSAQPNLSQPILNLLRDRAAPRIRMLTVAFTQPARTSGLSRRAADARDRCQMDQLVESADTVTGAPDRAEPGPRSGVSIGTAASTPARQR